MTQHEYDGLIIGSGHHGLILGSYMAKAGLKVAILDRRMMYGGGLETVQPGPPGFYQNLHSINHFNITATPWYRDLGLSVSVPYVTPRYDFAQPHSDGTALVFSRDLEETCASIARFSRKDADTFREWNAKADRISDWIFLPERYSEPLSEAERDELLSRSSLGRDFLQIIDRQPLDAVNELFENEMVKLLLLFKLSLFGTVLYDAVTKRSPMGALVRGFWRGRLPAFGVTAVVSSSSTSMSILTGLHRGGTAGRRVACCRRSRASSVPSMRWSSATR